MTINSTLEMVLETVTTRSQHTRGAYLARIEHAHTQRRSGHTELGCANLAHAWAALPENDRTIIRTKKVSAHIGLVNAYNDMLSAHQPLGYYPDIIKHSLRKHSATMQVAGGVPAMCDGVTQGTAGMELSLFSRDVIAQATAIALSHNVFDGVLMLGVCDKIVPGLLMGALAFGHLPTLFLPAGPMPSGLPNDQKASVRKAHAMGKATDEELMASEQASYHSPGTCTFYGTANTNQLLLEVLGLQLPGCSFPNPGTPERQAYIDATAAQIVTMTATSTFRPIGHIVNEAAILNAVVMLLASGGSTNHTIHLLAIAQLAGVQLKWQDMAQLSLVVPTLTRLYPNGSADFNALAANGGSAFLIHTLREHGLLIDNLPNAMGIGLTPYCQLSSIGHSKPEVPDLVWSSVKDRAADFDENIVRPVNNPFRHHGGLSLVVGNLGEAIVKTSALPNPSAVLKLPALVFSSQEAVISAFKEGKLDQSCAVVVTQQGPRANGMPELHKLMPILSVLQSKGFDVALITDGRLSGASGQVPAAIHVSPEAAAGGSIGMVRNGDEILLDLQSHILSWQPQTRAVKVSTPTDESHHYGMGRELFSTFRANVTAANTGALAIFKPELCQDA